MLKEFYHNIPMREELKGFLLHFRNRELQYSVDAGQGSEGYKEAREIIIKAFNELEKEFGSKPPTREQDEHR